MSYLSGIYLESWFSCFGERTQKNIEERKETDRRKTLKNRKKENRRIRGNSVNNNKDIWFYLLCKTYFARKHSLKKK